MGFLLMITTAILAINLATASPTPNPSTSLKKQGNFGPSPELPSVSLDDEPSKVFAYRDRGEEIGESPRMARAIVFRPIFTYRGQQAKKNRVFARRRDSQRRSAQRRKTQSKNKRRNGYYSYSSWNRNPSYYSRSGYPSWYVNAPVSYTF